MKIEVNGKEFDIEILGDKAVVNGGTVDIRLEGEEEITIAGKSFRLDFVEESEPSLMVINGMTYLVSKSGAASESTGELKAPINGQIIEVLESKGAEVKRGQLLVVLEA